MLRVASGVRERDTCPVGDAHQRNALDPQLPADILQVVDDVREGEEQQREPRAAPQAPISADISAVVSARSTGRGQRNAPERPVPRWSTRIRSRVASTGASVSAYRSVRAVMPSPGPPESTNMTPRAGLARARTRSTWSARDPGTTPVRSSATGTLAHSTECWRFGRQLVKLGAATASPAALANASATTKTASRRRLGMGGPFWWRENRRARLFSASRARNLNRRQLRGRSRRRDSNPRPTDYKSVALPAELLRRGAGNGTRPYCSTSRVFWWARILRLTRWSALSIVLQSQPRSSAISSYESPSR